MNSQRSGKKRSLKKSLNRGLETAGKFLGRRNPGALMAISGAVAGVVWLLQAGQAKASTTWDGGGTDTNINTANNWSDNVTPTLTGGSSNLTFGTAGGTATINLDVNVASITINRAAAFDIADGAGSLTIGSGGLITSGNYSRTINESSLILGASQTWNIGANTTTVSSVISESGSGYGITKTGTGTLALNLSSATTALANSFSGGVTIKAGTLTLANSLGAGGQATTPGGSSSATYYLGDTTGTTAATLNIANNNVIFNNPVTVQAGSSGVKTWSMATSGVSSSNSGTVTLNDNLTFNLLGTQTMSGSIVDGNQGAKGITKSGNGTLILSSTNTYTGTTSVSAGILTATKAAALSGYDTASKVIINGGILNLPLGGTGWTTGQVDTLLSNATKTSGSIGLDTGNGSITQWTALTSTNLGSLSLVKNGANTLTLDQANSFTGNVTLNQGTIKLTHSDALGTTTKTLYSEGASRTVQLSNSITLGSHITLRMTSNSGDGSGLYSADGNNTVQGNIVVTTGNPVLAIGSAAGSTLTITGNISLSSTARPLNFGGASTNANTVSGNISGALNVVKQSAGTWIFSGNNTWSGTTSVNGGMLVTTKAAALPNYNTSGKITVAGGATLAVKTGDGTSGWDAGQIDALRGNVTWSSNTSVLAIDTGSGNFAYSGNITQTLAVTKLGSNKLTLSGINTYSGKTTVSAGALEVTGSLANNGSSSVFIATDSDGGYTMDGASLARSILVSGAYAGFGSTEVGGLGSTAELRAGKNASGGDESLTMRWRTRSTLEQNGTHTPMPAPSGAFKLISDVVEVTGMAATPGATAGDRTKTDAFVLQMSYVDSGFGPAWTEAQAAAAGTIYLAWLDSNFDGSSGPAGTDLWKNAVDGNFGSNVTNAAYLNVQHDWNWFATTYGVTDGNLSGFQGAWGVDTSTNQVWAVLNHNSQFAVVPEPGSLSLLGMGAMALMGSRRRKPKKSAGETTLGRFYARRRMA